MNAPHSHKLLPDIQNHSPDIPLPLDNVGIRALRTRIQIPDKATGLQTTIATCSLGVRLSRTKRGAHMSRFIEVLNSWSGILEKNSVRKLLEELCLRLDSPCSMASFCFPFFTRKSSPSGKAADMAYECGIKAQLSGQSLSLSLSLEVPVMTVCPCSMAICEVGAHSQRALIRMRLDLADFIDFSRFIKFTENCGSSEVYTLLKREDEKLLTERAFANPAFVEDVARRTAFMLEKEKNILAFEVEVESMESIHNHSAFACISKSGEEPREA